MSRQHDVPTGTPGRHARLALTILAIFVLLQPGRARAENLEAVVEQQVRENETSASIQERIDEISEDTDAMVDQYRAALQSTRQLEVYNKQLASLVGAQEEEAASLRRQIDEVTVVGRQVMPHMERMIATLEKFIEIDVPFLPEERGNRVARLKDIMARADVTMSEKYRTTIEAYQIENDYGRTIEAYRGELEVEGAKRTVDFLRIGRNALLYQTLDGAESGAWNPLTRRWERLEDYRVEIREGIRMARKQRAPDLIQAPLPAPEDLR